jgi:threonine/homoserine/homoserine lactone efflux protein
MSMYTDLIAVAGLTVLIMISPGPDLALVVRNTLAGGKSAGGWTSLGILSGNLVHVSYCMLGIGWLIATSATAFTIVKLAGGAYLIFFGLQSIQAGVWLHRLLGSVLILLGLRLWLSKTPDFS